MSDAGPPITVSRDALRAEMAEMELRLMNAIRVELASKANVSDVSALRATVEVLMAARIRDDRGEFTPAQTASMRAIVGEVTTSRSDEGWTRRERFFGSLTAFVISATLVLSMVVAAKGGTL